MSDLEDENMEGLISRAIDKMAQRKDQPGILRICRFLRRKYGFQSKITRRIVAKLVQKGQLVQEIIKGEERYRNPVKLKISNMTAQVCHNNYVPDCRPQDDNEIPEENDTKQAIPMITADSPDIYNTLEDLIPMIQTQVSDGPSPALLGFALSMQECEDNDDPYGDHYPADFNAFRGDLARSLVNVGQPSHHWFDIGRFDGDGIFRFLPEAFFPPEMCKILYNSPSWYNRPCPMQNGKLKRARFTNKRSKRGGKHGVSSTVVKSEPEAQHSYQAEQMAIYMEEKCDFCQKGASSNKNGEAEDLLICKDCMAKAHPTCMDYGTELAIRSRLAPWQCINCKTCTVCGDSGNAETMLFCDCCDKGYHMSCHSPKVVEQPTGKWACQSCATELDISQDVPNGQESSLDNTVPPPADDHNGTNIEEDDEQCFTPDGFLENYPQVVPDATNWTVKDVERFVAKVGFPEQATAFSDQEIDGKSLLLMKRSDVLTALSIRLGPALKIYKHVERLQLFLGSGLQHY